MPQDNLNYLVLVVFGLGVVLLLIFALTWVLKKVSVVSARIARDGEDPRLSIREAVQVDHKRRLVLVRRDQVEHLLLIGGENDLLVEHHIPQQPFAQSPAVQSPAAQQPTSQLPFGQHPAQPRTVAQPQRPLPPQSAAGPVPGTPLAKSQTSLRPQTPQASTSANTASTARPAPAVKASMSDEQPEKPTLAKSAAILATTASSSLLGRGRSNDTDSTDTKAETPAKATAPQATQSNPPQPEAPKAASKENDQTNSKTADNNQIETPAPTQIKAPAIPPQMQNEPQWTAPESYQQNSKPAAPAVRTESKVQSASSNDARPDARTGGVDAPRTTSGSGEFAQPQQPQQPKLSQSDSEANLKKSPNSQAAPEKSYDDEINRLLSELSGDNKR
ncbi:flagellar biosynthetic protein FliO [Cohaesibacter celericrescens]|uniref:Flagellar biosynthesis protein FliO n=1 Tax=Cohaesibacter celericrescens TaxID=2067669 RepID=A0A2N5XWE1_9HYPH|nr:flagellar biosynthetic protein FliO [Cohaesibacter celericrescens]PLW78836.1 hypothetical protein C0081_00915 [Cohaesibacter celericrescens]